MCTDLEMKWRGKMNGKDNNFTTSVTSIYKLIICVCLKSFMDADGA